MNTKDLIFGLVNQTGCNALKALVLCLSFCLGTCGGSSGAAGIALDLDNGTQLQVSDMGSVPQSATASALAPDWWRGAFMQIYVRAYQDSDADGKGDLKGLIQRLDYLQGLGVKGLWLLPITESSDRDHGYAVKNYSLPACPISICAQATSKYSTMRICDFGSTEVLTDFDLMQSATSLKMGPAHGSPKLKIMG